MDFWIIKKKFSWIWTLGLMGISLLFNISGALAQPLKRIHDPVTIKFQKIPEFLDTQIENIRVYRYQNNQMEAIPFQIDERDHEGHYHFAFQNKKKKNLPPDQMEGKATPQDELVVLARDLGSNLKTLKNEPGSLAVKDIGTIHFEKIVAVSVLDPMDQSVGAIYVTLERTPSPRSPQKYMDYDKAQKIIMGENYRLKSNAIHINSLTIRKKDGEFTPSLVDKVKIHYEIKLIFNYTHSEEKLAVNIIFAKLGPIRLIQVIRVTPTLALGLKMPSADLNTWFYPNFYTCDVVVDLFFAPRIIFSKADFKVYYDFNTDLKPFEVFGNGFPPSPLIADGKTSEMEAQMPLGFPYYWTAMRHPTFGTTLLSKATKIKGLEDVTPTPLFFYKDDLLVEDSPEKQKGCLGCSGFFVDTLQLSRGLYKFHVHYFFLEDYQLGDEKPYLNLVDWPLEVKR